MVTVKAYRGTNSLDTDSTDCSSYRPDSRNTVELLLDQRVNQLTQLLRQTFAFRIPTPPQPDENEVDNGDRIDYSTNILDNTPLIHDSETSIEHVRKKIKEQSNVTQNIRLVFNRRFEEARLQSYENWPSLYVQPADLATAGFYYTGKNDSVRCFECHIEFSRWEEGEDPMVLHQRWSGRCCFIRKVPCGNVPIGADSNSIPIPRPRNRDTCGPYALEYRMGAEADSHVVETDKESGDDRPKFPKYASYEARLQSFDHWPISMAQTKEQLAEAGLYYVGSGDMTACYQCGVGLKSWEAQDDPWIQHAKWLPNCSYVRLAKGQEFVDSVVGKDVIPPLEGDIEKMTLTNDVAEPSIRQIHESVEELNLHSSSSQDVAGSISAETPIAKPRIKSTVNGENASSTTNSNGMSKVEESEDKVLDDATICKICYNEELGVVFVPCGHIVSCVKCAPSLTTCAVCRKKIEYYVRAYLS